MWLWEDRMGVLWGVGEPYGVPMGCGEPYGVWGEPRGSNVALGGFHGGAM